MTLLTLMSCATTPEIVTVTDTVKIKIPTVARPKQAQLYEVKIHVVNKDNYEDFIKQFKEKNGTEARIVVSVKDYENLSLNFSELRRYIQQQNEIIVYYEEAVQ